MNPTIKEMVIKAGPTSVAGIFRASNYDAGIRPYILHLGDNIEIYLAPKQAESILEDLVALLPDKARESLGVV